MTWHWNRGRGRSRSLKMASFDGSYTAFYWSAIVSMALCCTIFELFDFEQAVRLGGRHNMPPPRDLDFWPFGLEVGVGVACDLGYPCAKFRLPMPFGFRVRADVRDIRRTDGRTDDGRRWPPNAPASPTGRGHNNRDLDIWVIDH